MGFFITLIHALIICQSLASSIPAITVLLLLVATSFSIIAFIQSIGICASIEKIWREVGE